MSETRDLVEAAIRTGQAATAAMDQIDRSTVDEGVWNTLYQQCEAISQLSTALLFLVDD